MDMPSVALAIVAVTVWVTFEIIEVAFELVVTLESNPFGTSKEEKTLNTSTDSAETGLQPN